MGVDRIKEVRSSAGVVLSLLLWLLFVVVVRRGVVSTLTSVYFAMPSQVGHDGELSATALDFACKS